MRMPGKAVETNGVIVSDARVKWSFDTRIAYPFGFTMSCRSLEPNQQMQKKLFKKVNLSGRKEMQEFIRIVSQDDELLQVLVKCVAKGTRKPLDDYRIRIEVKERDKDKLEQLRRLLSLLKLPGFC